MSDTGDACVRVITGFLGSSTLMIVSLRPLLILDIPATEGQAEPHVVSEDFKAFSGGRTNFS